MTFPVGILTVDRIKPTAAMTSPANGANISGAITISATASDNDKVASVQFQIDGVNYGAPVLAAPYQIVGYDTHLLTAAAHTFGAIATDRLGNTSALAQVSANVTNALPAAGQTLLGNLLSWYGGDDEGTPPGFYSQRSGPEPYDGLSTTQGDWHWSQTGDRTTPVHFPANPDPTHYQMRAYFTGTRVEYGSAGNVVYIDVNLGAGWIEPYANSGYTPYIPLGNINGGEQFAAKRWCTNVGMNTCFCEGIAGAYDFALKPGYNS